MPYTWLIFDADNTLFDFDRAQVVALEQTFTTLGYRFESEHHALYESINAELWHAFERGELPQHAIKEGRFERLNEQTGWNFDVAKTSKSYLQNLAQGKFLLPGALDLVETLSHTHKLIIMTNGLKEVQRSRFETSPVSAYVQDILVSDELGVAKPNAGIYDIAFERMGLPNHKDVLMIGDSLNSDIRGGKNYGIDTCWFNPQGKANRSGLEPSYEIDLLSKLLDIVQ